MFQVNYGFSPYSKSYVACYFATHPLVMETLATCCNWKILPQAACCQSLLSNDDHVCFSVKPPKAKFS